MREIRSSGSAEGVVSNHDPYSDWVMIQPDQLMSDVERRRAKRLSCRAKRRLHLQRKDLFAAS